MTRRKVFYPASAGVLAPDPPVDAFFSESQERPTKPRLRGRRTYADSVFAEQGVAANYPGDVFSDPEPYAVLRRVRHRQAFPEPVECDLFHPGDSFPDSHELPPARRGSRRRIYPEPIENELGLLQHYPGDVFSETDARMEPRRKRIWIETVEAEKGVGAVYPGDVFSETDTRAMHVRRRVREPWQDDLSTTDVNSSIMPGALLVRVVFQPSYTVNVDFKPTYRVTVNILPPV